MLFRSEQAPLGMTTSAQYARDSHFASKSLIQQQRVEVNEEPAMLESAMLEPTAVPVQMPRSVESRSVESRSVEQGSVEHQQAPDPQAGMVEHVKPNDSQFFAQGLID